MNSRVITDYLALLFETSGDDAEWFGYYNYDTLSLDHTKMLCNRCNTEVSDADRNPNCQIDLGYYNLETGQWHKIATSDSWNWQQGSMLQWLPGEKNNNKVIFNCSKDKKLIARIVDVVTGESKDINWPIYGITPDGKKSISLDMERSYWCRAYHYASVANKDKEGRIVEGDGVFEIDLETNLRRLLIDIKDVVSLNPDADFDKKKHWVEHIMINPSGTRFCFLHRFSPVENVLEYRTRVCIANIDGSNLQVIPGWNTYMWSHFGWQDNDNFAIYSYKRPSFYKNFDVPKNNTVNLSKIPTAKLIIRKLALWVKGMIPKCLLKKMLPKNSYYQYYVLVDNRKYVLQSAWIKSYFDIDGHPSFTKDGKYMLTDSYPDQSNNRRYIVYNTLTQKGLIIARMPENRQSGNAACDLHPKLSRDNRFVVFDTTYLGKHSMMLFKLNWKEIQEAIG